MADILIRGMEMPDSKFHYVKLYVYGDGRVYVEDGNGMGISQRLSEQAVPLPEGHGRLGDLDALQDEFKKFHDGKRSMLIDTAPTIVPAEGGNADG